MFTTLFTVIAICLSISLIGVEWAFYRLPHYIRRDLYGGLETTTTWLDFAIFASITGAVICALEGW